MYLVLSLVNCREPSEWCPDRKRSLPTCRRSLAGCAAQILLASVPRSSAYSEGSRADGFAPAERPLSLSKSAVLVCFHTRIVDPASPRSTAGLLHITSHHPGRIAGRLGLRSVCGST